MIKIAKVGYSPGDPKEVGAYEGFCVYLWLEYEKNTEIHRRIVSISIWDALKMTDGNKRYYLDGQDYYIIPDKIEGIYTYILKLINAAYDQFGVITVDKYYEFAQKYLERYKGCYKNKVKVLESFYLQYVPEKMIDKYESMYKLFEKYQHDIERELSPYRTIPGGWDFVGCYYDENYTKRPIHERTEDKRFYEYVEVLLLCLKKELYN